MAGERALSLTSMPRSRDAHANHHGGSHRLSGPVGRIEGMNLRLYEPQNQRWSLTFVNLRDGLLTPVGSGADEVLFARHQRGLAVATVVAPEEGVEGVAATLARHVMGEVRVVGLLGVPHGPSSSRGAVRRSFDGASPMRLAYAESPQRTAQRAHSG